MEVIGDAYIVACGVPTFYKDHASEIAQVAIHILSDVAQFKIPHLPLQKLEIRIGLYTGETKDVLNVHELCHYLLCNNTYRSVLCIVLFNAQKTCKIELTKMAAI